MFTNSWNSCEMEKLFVNLIRCETIEEKGLKVPILSCTPRFIPQRIENRCSNTNCTWMFALPLLPTVRVETTQMPASKRWVNKMWYGYTIEGQSAIKMDRVPRQTQCEWIWKTCYLKEASHKGPMLHNVQNGKHTPDRKHFNCSQDLAERKSEK